MPGNTDFSIPEGKFVASVRIGPKGQIVIPKEVRDMFGLTAGDTLVLLADRERGIALNSLTYFNKIADAIYDGVPQAPVVIEKASGDRDFADVIKAMENGEEADK